MQVGHIHEAFIFNPKYFFHKYARTVYKNHFQIFFYYHEFIIIMITITRKT